MPYTLGAAPSPLVARVMAKLPAAPRLPAPAATVSVKPAPVPRGIVAHLVNRAQAPASGMAAKVAQLARQAAMRPTPAVIAPRSITPTAPTIAPGLKLPTGKLFQRVVQKAVARRGVTAQPAGAALPVPVSPFESQALQPAPAPAGVPLPDDSPFNYADEGPGPSEPTVPTELEDEQLVSDEDAAQPLQLRDAEPLDDLIPDFDALPDWLADAAPAMRAATDVEEPVVQFDPLDSIEFYGGLGQASETELADIEKVVGPTAATALGAAKNKPTDVFLGIGALLFALYVISRGNYHASGPGRRRGGKAYWD